MLGLLPPIFFFECLHMWWPNYANLNLIEHPSMAEMERRKMAGKKVWKNVIKHVTCTNFLHFCRSQKRQKPPGQNAHTHTHTPSNMNGDRHARLSAATPTLAQIPIRPHSHTHTHSGILRCHQKDCRLPCLSLLLLQSFWLWTADKKKGYERNRTGKKIVPLQRIKIQKVKRKVKDFKIRPGPKWLSVCRNESREFVKKKGELSKDDS